MMGAGNFNKISSSSHWIFQFVVFCLVAVLATVAAAQSGGSYELNQSTIDGGGGVSSGGQYIVRGTIGQPDASYSYGGDYELVGGFLSEVPFCVVDFYHYARFAEYWLESGSDLPANLDDDETVDFYDLKLFVDEWMYYCPYGWPLK